jgi:ABC-type glycerol-3-phosphate transport system substrate-binding protein
MPLMSDEAGDPRRKTSRREVLRAASVALRGFAFAGVLAACGSDSVAPTPAAGTVKFINSGDSAAQGRMQGYINAFQKSTGIPVSLLSIQDYYTQNIQAMVAAGVPPDALYISRAEFDVLYPINKLADLHGYLGNGSGTAAFFPATLAEWQRENKLYAMPFGMRTVFVAYNAGLYNQNKLTAPPSTWSASGWTITDFANAAMKITQPGSSSQDPDYGFYVDPTYPVWSTVVINAGGAVVNEQNRTIDVDQPPAIQAMTVLQNVLRAPGVMPPGDLVSADGGIDLFANGNLGMTITDPSTIDPRQNQSHFPWDVGAMPSGAGGRFTAGTGAGYGLVAGSKNADRGWKLIEYLTGENIQKQEAPYGRWIPSRPAVANSADFLPELNNVDLAPQHAKVYVDAISDNRVKLQPAIKNWPDVLTALEAGIQGLWTGALTPEAAAAQMKKLAEPLLKQS